MIADNDTEVSSLLADVLMRSGMSVQCCFDGEAACALARAPEVRVLVCDLDMPRASGVEVVESLRGLASPPAGLVVAGSRDPAGASRLWAGPFGRGGV
ncbi:MAG: response regulator, partial [Planctomycetota bacterium]